MRRASRHPLVSKTPLGRRWQIEASLRHHVNVLASCLTQLNVAEGAERWLLEVDIPCVL